MALTDSSTNGTYFEPIVWKYWIGTSNSTKTMSLKADYVWDGWITANTLAVSAVTKFTNTLTTYSATTTFRDIIWNEWQNEPATPDYYRTPEEIQADADAAQARREEASRRALAREAVRVQAEDRAMELLMTLLTEEETRYYLEHDEIQVRSEHGNLYVIEKRGVHGNIRQVDEHGCMLGRICVAPVMYDDERRALPLADGWIGQYLMLKHDEDRIIGRGNWSSRRVCQMPDVPILRAVA